jgi:hypothetical protein
MYTTLKLQFMKFRFNLTQFAVLSFIFSLLMVTSCSKENSRSASDDEQEVTASQVSGESDAQAEIIFNGLFDDAMGVSDEVGMAGTGVFGRINACPNVTLTHLNPPSIFPIRVVLDFGNAGCMGTDGRTRSGKVIIEYTNKLLYPGATATTTFDGFYVDSVHVEGIHKITNTSNGTTNRQFTVTVRDAKLTRPNGDYVKWKSDKVINQIEGLSTLDFHDDVFSITGTAQGQVKRGNLLVAWESSITDPLMKRFTCRWIVKGRIRTVRINTNPTSTWVAVLDFGNGVCDNLAVLTINGVSHQITLP